MADTARIDASGRLVLPKRVRDALGLTSGVRLRVSIEGDGLLLTPLPTQSAPREEEGLLVIAGQLAGPVMDHRALRQQRLARFG